jgi:antitoxin PrlF
MEAGRRLDSKANIPYFACMSFLKVTAKGQVTLRKEVLEHLGVSPGEQIEVELLPQGRVAVKAAPKKKIQDLFGIMHDPKRAPVSIEDMNKAIAAGWAGKRK